MALGTQITYSAKCDDCERLACGGCFSNSKQNALGCARGCSWRQANDNTKVIYCPDCESAHQCRACNRVYENLNDRLCKPCEEKK